MNSKERMKLAMRGEKTDRIPVMCQLSLGHIYKNAGIGPVDYWWDSEGYAEGFIRMAELYKFDGILLNITGVDPEDKKRISDVRQIRNGHIVTMDNGDEILVPFDDDPRPLNKHIEEKRIAIYDFDINSVHTIKSEAELPPYYFDIMNYVMDRKGEELSIHGEVGTAFELFLRLFGSFEGGLMALVDDPDKSIEIIKILNKEVIIKAIAQCKRGIDALKLSSPLASASFISRRMYEEFVLPFEKEIVDSVKNQFEIPCYIHTCGKIGDRLDLIVETGVAGIECLDPTPLGDVDLSKAIEEIGEKVFIKGNLDSVSELLDKTPEQVEEIATERLRIAEKCKKGYILSSACSVSPHVPPENILKLHQVVVDYAMRKA